MGSLWSLENRGKVSALLERAKADGSLRYSIHLGLSWVDKLPSTEPFQKSGPLANRL